MGYTTHFDGVFTITPALRPEHRQYLEAFSKTRRMKRNRKIVAGMPDPVREAAGLPAGPEGGYFVGGGGFHGQDDDASVVDHNKPPKGQPGLWCQWEPDESGKFLRWDEGEKFYDYVKWLEYLIRHFLQPWGHTLSGEVRWSGEESDDRGVIYVKDNVVEAVEDVIANPGPNWAPAGKGDHVKLARAVLANPGDPAAWAALVDVCYEKRAR